MEKNKERMLQCPLCPTCNKFMLQSMCIAYNEYVCIPCGIAKPWGFGVENLISETTHNKLYEKYSKDIHKLAFKEGGASCGKCRNRGGNNCNICNINYDYKYWNKKIRK